MPSIVSEVENLRIIYKEIIDGCSHSEKNGVYIKHLTDLDTSEILRKKISIFEAHRADGLPSDEEKLQQIIESEQWSAAKEEEIIDYQYLISDNEKNLPKIIPYQHGPILKIIKDAKDKLAILQEEKQQLLGRTANQFAERDSFNYFIYLSLYKDRECKNLLFDNFKEFSDLSDEDIIKFIQAVEEKLSALSEKNIIKISVLPFFLNPFSYSKENLYTFLAKPLVLLTQFQTLLFSLGMRNLNILSQSDGKPPELIGDTKIEDIVLWIDTQYSLALGKRNSPK